MKLCEAPWRAKIKNKKARNQKVFQQLNTEETWKKRNEKNLCNLQRISKFAEF